ncbi:GNAT family N-acetyltransferase [Pseudoduganella namucuonensis]|uniref:GNAT family N-acetyltransferase n=1 Tax=Pseudoduganella namucuonensis TaxID=1035707 RepID=UPI0015A4F6EC|nr:GNAT family N-acetyltransferase [Pseudoduganella namucuonensis]
MDDIPGMHKVRLAVRENPLTSSFIREEHYVPEITVTGDGWVIEKDGGIVAFAIGNKLTGNIWALFVDPSHEGRGYGSRLHDVMVESLLAQGLDSLNLSTGADTRARVFYECKGWRQVACRDGDVWFEYAAGANSANSS